MLRVKYLYSPCPVTTINIHVLTTLKKRHHRFGTSLLFYPRFPVPTLFQSSLLPIVWHWWGGPIPYLLIKYCAEICLTSCSLAMQLKNSTELESIVDDIARKQVHYVPIDPGKLILLVLLSRGMCSWQKFGYINFACKMYAFCSR